MIAVVYAAAHASPAPEPLTERDRAPSAAQAHALVALQHTAGNQAVARYVAAQALARVPSDGSQGSGGGVPAAPAPSTGNAPGTDGSGGGPPAAPAPAAAPGDSPDALPLSGEAHVRLNEGMTFPLGGTDLGDLSIGKGKLATPSIPIFETGLEASVEVGAHNPMRVQGQRVEVSPIVVKISAEQIAKRHGEREDQARDSGAAKAAAAVGGIIGGLTPAGWIMGGPGAVATRAGNAVKSVVETGIEQTFRAELEQATVKAHFPIVYNPYMTLGLGATGLSGFIAAELTLQTSWDLDLQPFLSLGNPGATAKGTGIEVSFTDGKLTRAAFNLALTGGLEIDLSAMGMASGHLRILRILDDSEKTRDPGVVDVSLFATDVFELLKAHLAFQATADLELATGSAVKVRGERVAARPSAKSCTDVLMDMIKGQALGQRVKRNVTRERGPDEAADWHAGTRDDPIPITYYKPLTAYRHALTARNGAKTVTITNWPHQLYDELAEDPDFLGVHDDDVADKGWKVGIANRNVPTKGKKLTRTTPGLRSESKKWKRIAKRFEIDLEGAEVDHVIDLGLGGDDLPDNLWPIEENANRRGGEAMYGQEVRPPWQPKTYAGPPTTVLSLPPGTELEIRKIREP